MILTDNPANPDLEIEAESIYANSLIEHTELNDFSKDRLLAVISGALNRIVELEQVAVDPIDISPETAGDIETIWEISGTGNYDKSFTAEDNPKLDDKPWMGGWDRARMNRSAYLARKIAEVRSGHTIKSRPLDEIDKQKQEMKELILEYGPTIFYNGYKQQTVDAENVLSRSGIIIPKQKTLFVDSDLKNTTDQIKTFKYPDMDNAKDKQVVVVSHAPHLGARVLHLIEKIKPFSHGSVPYLSPIASPEIAKKEFRFMEIRGLLYYIFLKNDASEQPSSYKLI